MTPTECPKSRFKQHAKAIAFLPESERARYSKIQSESKEPARAPGITVNGIIEDAVAITTSVELSDDELRAQIRADVTNRWTGHLYQDPVDGKYWKKPSPTDGLERAVLNAELGEAGFVAWYRNPTGGERALCIPYIDSGSNRWSRLFPDFIFFHAVGDGIRASIVDPHGIQLEDWADKLRGYVAYADSHASEFRAIAPLTQIDGKSLILPIHDAATRAKVSAALDAGDSVEAIFRKHGIDY